KPDECYYLTNAERVVGRRIDLSVDPPPDLAIEVEISRSALDRIGIYAALGVPEVWRFDGEALRVEQLQADGTYREVAASPGLPFLSSEEVVQWLRLAETMGQTPWLRQFREWVRDELAPRFGGG
ncbi:MAG: Uma2 family endonuclease, partial [Planctomycetaceae bacterium]|nr:Uma2 family endonuclease [Planctomycetaceae bacterium]